MDNYELKERWKRAEERWKRYIKARTEFEHTHGTAQCEQCGEEIIPGNDFVLFDGMTFCDGKCVAFYVGAKEMIFNEGDAEYASYFPPKEEGE